MLDWLDENYKNKMIADKNFENTDYAFKLYAQTLRKLDFKNYYTPSKGQKSNELLYVGVGGLVIGGAAAYIIWSSFWKATRTISQLI